MPLFVVAIRTLLQPVSPEDYWWSLAMGELIVQGDWPDRAAFLYTMPADTPFYSQAWLSQWSMATLAGVSHLANYLTHLALLLGTWTLLVLAALRRGAAPLVVGIGAALAHYMAAGGLTVRTQMFAYPIFAGFVVLLLEQTNEPKTWRWVAMFALAVLWANVHGTFVMAPLLVGAAGAGVAIERWRRGENQQTTLVWGAALVAMAVATCVSPGGFDNLAYLSGYFEATKGAAFVSEWQPPPLFAPQGLVFWVALAATLAWLFRHRDLRWAELGIFALMTVITVGSVRAILWWGIVWVLLFAPAVSRTFADRLTRDEPSTMTGALNAALLGAMVAATIAALPGMPLFDRVDTRPMWGEARLNTDDPELRIFSARNPVPLVRDLLDDDPGPIFHHQHLAGLIEWELLRRHRPDELPRLVFIDQRLELFSVDDWLEYYRVSKADEGWRDILDRYDVDTLILHPDEQRPLIEALRHDTTFEQTQTFGSWRLYARR